MKKIVSIIISIILVVSFMGCNNNNENPESNVENTEITTIVSDYNETSDNTTSSVNNDDKGLSVFGHNYTNSEETTLRYLGDDVTMKINISNGSVGEFGLGIYVVVNGIFVESSIQQFLDENFIDPISDVSMKSEFHQTDLNENETKYYSLSFKPDMFEKGTTVYAEVFCTLNNQYIPEGETVNKDMIGTLRIYSSTVEILVDKENDIARSQNCKTDSLAPSYSEEGQSGISEFNIYGSNSSSDGILSVKKGEKAKLILEAKTDAICSERTAMISIIVNNEVYPAFEGKKYLELNLKPNTHYEYEILIDTSKLDGVNNVYFYAEDIDIKNIMGYNSMIIPSNEFMFIRVE